MLANLKYRVKLLIRNGIGWSGDYDTWQEAAGRAGGYDQEEILEKVLAATLKVKSGEAVYERDSVIFDKVEYSFPLLSALMFVAATRRQLSVLDFGGSLGSSYFQNKRFLDSLKQVDWTIVEQPNFVSVGQQQIADAILHFQTTMQEAVSRFNPNLFLISCCLQYIEKPYDLIDEITGMGFPYLILDNTPFNYEARDRITLQKVPPSIYQASYACWFLDYDKVLSRFLQRYQLITEFTNDTSIELDGQQIPYRGFLLELKKDKCGSLIKY